LAQIEISLARHNEAAVWVRRSRDISSDLATPRSRADAARAAAELALARGQASAAVAHAERAAAQHAIAGRPVDTARDRLLAAHGYARLGDVKSARTLLRSAQAAAYESGAQRLHSRIERQLALDGPRAASAAVPALPPGGAARLTARERETALLVADGLSNREIAERLHLSDRTVERHLTTIRRKLAVPSRLALVAVVAGHRQQFRSG
jgi:DNA-binding CsgD family transcriptional regulator